MHQMFYSMQFPSCKVSKSSMEHGEGLIPKNEKKLCVLTLSLGQPRMCHVVTQMHYVMCDYVVAECQKAKWQSHSI